ncbi:hypothetical protein ACFFQW_32960 [Umezawaea endophytica]|uniref:Uncharacterized protein n=1 Tax=Umezawaea endophytica TaxID=1654476 RepID=A0A9X3AIA4_9PSEU|nr:hypothetical protein [Umezawaea endophytica]MCS7482251.1 hypothetical protein [Umezawaea endophytica]
MQRPTTTGRRHNRVGSITVAELIRKQPSPVRIPSREEAETDVLVVDVLGLEESPHRRRPNRAAKAAGLMTGALVLFASVAAASILAGKRPQGPEEQPVAAPIELSGSTALRPDLLSARLGNDPAPVPGAAATGSPGTSPSAVPVPNAPLAADPKRDPGTPPATTAAPPTVPSTSQPKIDVVRGFYDLLPANPAEASRLLTADLVGGNTLDFIRSWSTIRAITVESTTLQPEGSVLAEVSMQELDGRWLRVLQRFWFADTSTPKIIATELLSAQLR